MFFLPYVFTRSVPSGTFPQWYQYINFCPFAYSTVYIQDCLFSIKGLQHISYVTKTNSGFLRAFRLHTKGTADPVVLLHIQPLAIIPYNNRRIISRRIFKNPHFQSSAFPKAMANDMGFVIPFKNAQESPNLFVKVDNALTAEGKTPVAWCFSTMPSENWKNGVGSALTAYAAGTGDWNAVVTAFVDGWKTEAALNAG